MDIKLSAYNLIALGHVAKSRGISYKTQPRLVG